MTRGLSGRVRARGGDLGQAGAVQMRRDRLESRDVVFSGAGVRGNEERNRAGP